MIQITYIPKIARGANKKLNLQVEDYVVIFDDQVEAYCRTLKAAREVVNDMVKLYTCRTLSEGAIRKDTVIYKVKRVK